MPALPQSGVGFPVIPGVAYNGRTTTGDQFDFGSQFGQGILTTLPPSITTSAYPVFVPRTDADGNDLAGIRLPEFPATRGERVASGDPRPSIQERYRSHAGYVARVTLTAANLANDRLLLREDVLRYIAKAVISPVGR